MSDSVDSLAAVTAARGTAPARRGEAAAPRAASAGAAAGAGDPARAQRLRAVAEEFESLLVSTLLRSMRATIPETGLMDGGEATKQYRQLYDDELARTAARSGRGLGIADLIVSRYGGGEGAAPSPGAAPASGGSAWDLFGDPARAVDSEWPLAPGPVVTRPGRAAAPARGGGAAPRAAGGLPAAAGPAAMADDAGRRPAAAGPGVELAAPAAPTGPGLAAPDEAPGAADADGGGRRAEQAAGGIPLPPLAAAAAEATAATPAALAAYRRARSDDAAGQRWAELRTAASAVGGAVADSLQRYGAEIRQATAETGVDPALLLSVLVQESGGNARARSPKGALGLMQLLPGTAAEVGVRRPWHPEENIVGGARYLARLLARFGQRLDLALAGYNAGPGAVERAGRQVPPYRETQRYVGRVQDLYARLGGGDGTNLATPGAQP